jgi:hypothetical protein
MFSWPAAVEMHLLSCGGYRIIRAQGRQQGDGGKQAWRGLRCRP